MSLSFTLLISSRPLHWAADRGHVDAMEKLLQNKADLNDGEQDNVWTPLHMAASTGEIKAMKLLMNGHYGVANVNAISKGDGTALAVAVSFSQVKAVDLLLANGANPTLTADDGESPVAIAAYTGQDELLDTLLERGAGENLASKKFGSALASAASAGHEVIVRKLLHYSDEAALQGALEEATRNGYNIIVQLLLQSSQNLECNEAFETAASLGHDLVLEELWKHNISLGGTTITKEAVNNALYKATDFEQETTVTLLLHHYGADPDATGVPEGNALTASAYDGTLTILKILLDAGADVNAPTGYPLQIASSAGHLEVVKLLLNHGASINAVNPLSENGTALQEACVSRQVDVAKELLAHGADPNLGGGLMTNPITAATSNGLGDLVLLLIEKGAELNVFGGEDGSTPLINAACTLKSEYLAAMINHGASVNTADPDEDTALIMSASFGDSDCVRVLLEHKVNVNFCGKHHGTALHAAAANGQSETFRLLLQNGANPTVRGGPYDTVIQAVAYSGDGDCMKALLVESKIWKEKIDVNAQGGEKFTPLHAAAANSGDECLRLLLDRKPKLNILPKGNSNAGAPLYAATFAGCNRNARLLLEAGADANSGAGKHGSILQVAALKCGVELCDLLIDHGAVFQNWSGKYGSALVAAVVRDYHENDTDVLEFLLEKDFTAQAYRAALEKAFVLQRENAFKLIWLSIKSKDAKKLKLSTKQLLQYFQSRVRKRDSRSKEIEDENSDFEDDVDYQEFEDEEAVEDNDTDVEEHKEQPTPQTSTRGTQAPGDANVKSSISRGIDGSQEANGGQAVYGGQSVGGNQGPVGNRGIAGSRGVGGNRETGDRNAVSGTYPERVRNTGQAVNTQGDYNNSSQGAKPSAYGEDEEVDREAETSGDYHDNEEVEDADQNDYTSKEVENEDAEENGNGDDAKQEDEEETGKGEEENDDGDGGNEDDEEEPEEGEEEHEEEGNEETGDAEEVTEEDVEEDEEEEDEE